MRLLCSSWMSESTQPALDGPPPFLLEFPRAHLDATSPLTPSDLQSGSWPCGRTSSTWSHQWGHTVLAFLWLWNKPQQTWWFTPTEMHLFPGSWRPRSGCHPQGCTPAERARGGAVPDSSNSDSPRHPWLLDTPLQS